ncbi:hypothetical protein Tco_0697910 [Tanacetum coccineum]
MGLGYNESEASTSETKQVKFVKSTETVATTFGFAKDRDGFLKDKETIAPSAAEDRPVSKLNHNLTSKPKHLVINKVKDQNPDSVHINLTTLKEA